QGSERGLCALTPMAARRKGRPSHGGPPFVILSRLRPAQNLVQSCAILSDSSATQGLKDSSRLGPLPMAARYSLAQWAHLRWTRMLLGRGAGNPLLRGSRGFRPIRGCRNHMNDLVAAAF